MLDDLIFTFIRDDFKNGVGIGTKFYSILCACVCAFSILWYFQD